MIVFGQKTKHISLKIKSTIDDEDDDGSNVLEEDDMESKYIVIMIS